MPNLIETEENIFGVQVSGKNLCGSNVSQFYNAFKSFTYNNSRSSQAISIYELFCNDQ